MDKNETKLYAWRYISTAVSICILRSMCEIICIFTLNCMIYNCRTFVYKCLTLTLT